jgi:error-prone DNA polymerase
VITLPIDVNHSRWDCTLEQIDDRGTMGERPHRAASFARKWAVRMGFCMIKGLGTREQERLEVLPRPVRTVEDFARKTQLSLNALVSLAEAGAFESMGHTRREALWRVRAACPSSRDPMRSEPGSDTPALRPLSVPEQVLWDYRTAQHSTRGHPMEPLRPWLAQRGIKSASEVRELPSGKQAEYVGLVICRQRPGTATGVVFLTLEDEQGFVNVVIWTAVFERYQRVARTASLLGVRGKIQAKDGVVHLIAEELYAPNVTTGGDMLVRSRDFH